MTKWLLSAALSVLALTLTGCFDIIEEITFNKDGSGNARYLVDMKKTAELLEMMGDENGANTDAELAALMNTDSSYLFIKNRLAQVSGLSNIEAGFNAETFTTTYTFGFANVDALNMALALLAREEGAANYHPYTWKKHFVTRSNDIRLSMDDWMSGDDEPMEDSVAIAMQSMFESVDYKVILHLPAKTKKVTCANTDAAYSAEDKTVRWQCTLAGLKSGACALTNEVKFK